LPGLDGLALQRELAAREITTPIVFISGHGDVPMSVQAMKAGALDFLTKPFHDQDLLNAVERGLVEDVKIRRARAIVTEITRRLDLLTARERDVFDLVITGLLNKQIGAQLGIVEKTVKVHRARVMVKMEVKSVAELVHFAELLRTAGR
jgi:FixJ family two-component response regulator